MNCKAMSRSAFEKTRSRLKSVVPSAATVSPRKKTAASAVPRGPSAHGPNPAEGGRGDVGCPGIAAAPLI